MAISAAQRALYGHLQQVIADQRVLQAFLQVPREQFVPRQFREDAYEDRPLPIGHGQTISQPTTVLLMTSFLQVREGQKILEIGAGSGYQAAILAEIIGPKGKVITLEVHKELAVFAKKNLHSYTNVQVIHTDGSGGYSKEAPYDRILITAACPTLPQHLLHQLNKDGILVAPVGDLAVQTMVRIRKGEEPEALGQFVFVPLQGKYGFTSSTQSL
ncbi:protein-L-isoaspartate(D-aspartate) O-methyltransferase [Candidatus Woesearchaeota archaeon]|nr:protein-L-isoaspartate(D-aspartate) O-methyltransferase [Candidatus Woesearchaeota archaeon]